MGTGWFFRCACLVSGSNGWVQVARKMAPASGASAAPSDSAEIRRLKAELRRVTEERDILKKAAAYFAKG